MAWLRLVAPASHFGGKLWLCMFERFAATDPYAPGTHQLHPACRARVNALVPCAFNAGNLPTRGACAEVGADISERLPRGESRTAGTEGLSMRLRGDGHTYTCILRTSDGLKYAARFPTRNGYSTVRLPFATFRSEQPNQPSLKPESLQRMTIRYDHRRAAAVAPPAAAVNAAAGQPGQPAPAVPGSSNLNTQKFNLEVDWIKVRRCDVLCQLAASVKCWLARGAGCADAAAPVRCSGAAPVLFQQGLSSYDVDIDY